MLKPINVYIDVPLYILKNEKFVLSIDVDNNQEIEHEIIFNEPEKFSLNLKPGETNDYKMTFESFNLPFTIADQNKDFQYLVNPQVINDGIKMDHSSNMYISYKLPELELGVKLPEEIEIGSGKLKICHISSSLNMILEALKSLNRMPFGCFEQASSTSFPLVIALKVLLRFTKTNEIKSLIKKMIDNLKKGINLLLSYESPSGGFEWFGKDPGHSTLTAYGLWQFIEIDSLEIDDQLFDKSLLDRLKEFLKNSKNNKGGYKITRGLDALGNPDQLTSDIYINFILSKHLDDGLDLDKEFEFID